MNTKKLQLNNTKALSEDIIPYKTVEIPLTTIHFPLQANTIHIGIFRAEERV